jgi:CheY-like chemotaxis protein
MGIINQTLDMSKIEAGKLKLHRTSFSFQNMINTATSLLELQAADKNLSLTISLSKDIPQYIVCDELRLVQVITNLLNNAIKFTENGGTVDFTVTTINEKHLLFEFKDSGIGISAEQQSRLFSAFEQAEAYTTHKFGGTGLGLPISKQIVKMFDGEIWVESELGKGSKFSFTIPCEQGEKPPKEAPSPTDTAHFKNKTILLAEDIEINREIALAMLKPTGVNIACAENGLQAIEMFRDEPSRFHLIFMDLQMPEVDGITATRQIRALDIPQAKTIPIIAMTANVFQDDINTCIEAGMNAHLGKPLNIQEALKIMQEFLH